MHLVTPRRVRALIVGAAIMAAPAVSYAQISESFDNISTLAGDGWVLTNRSDPSGIIGWFQGNSGVFTANSGAPNAYIGANFNSTAGAGTISNWLITPQVALLNGAQFSFYTRTVDGSPFADRLEVRLSTAGASSDVGASESSVGDFNQLLLSINPSLDVGGFPEAWTKYTVTLSGLAPAAMGRIAFRYFVEDGGPNGSRSNYIGIDDVNYSSTVPEPSSFLLAAAGFAGIAALRRRRA